MYLVDNYYQFVGCVAYIHIKVADTYDVIFKTYKEQTNENIKLLKMCCLKNYWGTKYVNSLIQENISVGADKGWVPGEEVSRTEAAQFIAKTEWKPRVSFL
ncbi:MULTISPECIES: hypothetical protein [Bacillus cereus group]|uniref:hypothetical protein n=1 Tax=Bacillus cereus TaxID=1396 RepID=UPI0035303231